MKSAFRSCVGRFTWLRTKADEACVHWGKAGEERKGEKLEVSRAVLERSVEQLGPMMLALWWFLGAVPGAAFEKALGWLMLMVLVSGRFV